MYKSSEEVVHTWLLELICLPASAPGKLLAPTLNMQAHKAFDSPRRQKRRGGGRSLHRLNCGLRVGRPLRRKRDLIVVTFRNGRYKGGDLDSGRPPSP